MQAWTPPQPQVCVRVGTLQAYADARQKPFERAVPAEISGFDDPSARAGAPTLDGKARA